MDPFVLAAHAHPRPGDIVMDIGTGVGIIPLILCHRIPNLCITAVEIQETLALTARENIRINQREREITVHHQDIRQMLTPDHLSSQDMVIANPPYRKQHHGRLNPQAQKAIARHELALNLDTLVKCASKLLKPQGIFHTIYPVQRLPELLAALTREAVNPDTLRFIHPRKTENAKLFMISATKGQNNELSILPPLYLHTAGNRQTRALQLLLNGTPAWF